MLQPTPLALATLLLLASASFIPAGARADPEPTHALPDDKGIYSFSLENDIFAGSDSDYTNGVRFAYVSPESHVPGWLERTADALPFFDETGRKRWSFAFGQNIYTPSNISTSLPQPNDEPYAGWLYGTAGVMSDTGRDARHVRDHARHGRPRLGRRADAGIRAQPHRLAAPAGLAVPAA